MRLVLALLITFTIPHVIAFDISKMTSTGGGLIGGTDPLHAFESMSDGENKYIVLKKNIGKKDNSIDWVYVDHLLIPKLDDKYRLYVSMCKINDVFNSSIIAIGEYETEIEWSTIVKKAWVADIKVGQFEVLDSKNIACINDDYHL